MDLLHHLVAVCSFDYSEKLSFNSSYCRLPKALNKDPFVKKGEISRLIRQKGLKPYQFQTEMVFLVDRGGLGGN